MKKHRMASSSDIIYGYIAIGAVAIVPWAFLSVVRSDIYVDRHRNTIAQMLGVCVCACTDDVVGLEFDFFLSLSLSLLFRSADFRSARNTSASQIKYIILFFSSSST